MHNLRLPRRENLTIGNLNINSLSNNISNLSIFLHDFPDRKKPKKTRLATWVPQCKWNKAREQHCICSFSTKLGQEGTEMSAVEGSLNLKKRGLKLSFENRFVPISPYPKISGFCKWIYKPPNFSNLGMFFQQIQSLFK